MSRPLSGCTEVAPPDEAEVETEVEGVGGATGGRGGVEGGGGGTGGRELGRSGGRTEEVGERAPRSATEGAGDAHQVDRLARSEPDALHADHSISSHSTLS